jgi:mono/diheme cytochrome c family protein
MTKIISLMAILGCTAMVITSCGKKNENSPGVEYMPDMYRSPSLESNMSYVRIDSNNAETTDTLMANRMPVAGTIARGFLPYGYPNTPEGYAASAANVNPLEATEANIKDGEVLYGKFCVHCHGTGGEADGKVAGKLLGPPPAYSTLKDLPDGKMFHTITYGKGLMGPHAPLVSQTERWKLVLYIRHLQFPNGRPMVADSTAAKTKAPVAKKK